MVWNNIVSDLLKEAARFRFKNGKIALLDIYLPSLCTGGMDYLEARQAGASEGTCATLDDAVNWVYYSGHGYLFDGKLRVTRDPKDPDPAANLVGAGDVHWEHGVDLVIIAGCSVLDINNYNNNPAYIEDHKTLYWNHNPSPGKLWADRGPKYLLGYNYSAPADSPKDPSFVNSTTIINNWFTAKASHSYEQAWGDANNNSGGRNACAIVNGDTYWYFQKTGISSTTISGRVKSKEWIGENKHNQNK